MDRSPDPGRCDLHDNALDLLALACAVGIVGTLFPVLPGLSARCGPGVFHRGATGWGVAVAAVVLV